jgi:predicted RNase H-related nuclease YkuK (DUF458 family)
MFRKKSINSKIHLTVEQKKKLNESIAKHITDYLAAGGTITQCKPCTYSDSQRLTMAKYLK